MCIFIYNYAFTEYIIIYLMTLLSGQSANSNSSWLLSQSWQAIREDSPSSEEAISSLWFKAWQTKIWPKCWLCSCKWEAPKEIYQHKSEDTYYSSGGACNNPQACTKRLCTDAAKQSRQDSQASLPAKHEQQSSKEYHWEWFLWFWQSTAYSIP